MTLAKNIQQRAHVWSVADSYTVVRLPFGKRVFVPLWTIPRTAAHKSALVRKSMLALGKEESSFQQVVARGEALGTKESLQKCRCGGATGLFREYLELTAGVEPILH